MLDHLGLSVSDFAAARQLYARALAPLGYLPLMDRGQVCGLGVDGKPDFWIHQGAPTQPPVHVAFAAKDRATVDAFYAAAIAAGARDHGAPGLRPEYHPNYYGAFVLDADGNNIEAVCHRPA